jgi:putative hydrolase of the HAD superfamily
MPLSRYRAVFFDVGGTLLKVHPSVGAVYAGEARAFGYTGSAEALDAGFRAQWKATGGIESLDGQSGRAVEKRFWKDLVEKVFEPSGGLKNFDEYFDRVYSLFQKKDSWRVFEDVAHSRIFERLKARGVVLGVISNWDSRLPETLKNLGLADHFDFILASTVVGSAKPNPRIFAQAIAMSRVQPGEACHIGDEVATDIEGAAAAGIDAILVDRDNRHPVAQAPRVRSFMDLVDGSP